MIARVVPWSANSLEIAPASVVTLGVFDGLHLGHQALIAEAVSAASREGVPSACVTFFPSPDVVLRGAAPRYLLPPDERAAVLASLGIDVVVVARFDRELAALPADEFMTLLQAVLHPVEVWVGEDFALGRGRQGDAETLAALGNDLGYRLGVVPRVRLDGDVVSSSLIRSLLGRGEVERASSLLGRPYVLIGPVLRGFGVGAGLGYPTANVGVPADKALPADGVYAAVAWLAGSGWPAAVNIGVRPTFGGTPRAVEAHLVDFSGDIYGERLSLSIVARLRDEMRFGSADALKQQLALDEARTRAIVTALGPDEGAPPWALLRSPTPPT